MTPYIDGATCLDLFAGSGSLGFEAISRGAEACQFIDRSQTNIEQINLNIKSLQLANCKSEISESYEYVTHNDQRYDIVFFDPPYKSNCYDWLDLALKKLLKPDGIIYIESATKIALDNLSMIREKKTKTLFYGIYNLINKIIYPGSFDPITKGHEDIINQLQNLASVVIVAIAEDNGKNSLYTIDQRLHLLNELYQNYANIEIISYSGLTVDLAKKNNVTVIARGLRNEIDFTYERDLSDMNQKIEGSIKTIFLQSDPSLRSISSSLVRQLIHLDKDLTPFLSKKVTNLINAWR